jgi:hypothetical protein
MSFQHSISFELEWSGNRKVNYKKKKTYDNVGDNPRLFERLEKKTNDTTGEENTDNL